MVRTDCIGGGIDSQGVVDKVGTQSPRGGGKGNGNAGVSGIGNCDRGRCDRPACAVAPGQEEIESACGGNVARFDRDRRRRERELS